MDNTSMLNIRVPAATAAWLKKRSEETLVPTSAYIRKLIADDKAKAESGTQ
jgi:hypothetical protein